MIVLDTDVLIEIFDKESEGGEEIFEEVKERGEDLNITVVNLHEILYGLKKYSKPVKDVLRLPVLSYMRRDARLASELELGAEEEGKSIRRTDAMIAAMVMNNGGRLCTFDAKHFKHLESMGLELFPVD